MLEMWRLYIKNCGEIDKAQTVMLDVSFWFMEHSLRLVYVRDPLL